MGNFIEMIVILKIPKYLKKVILSVSNSEDMN